MINEEISLLQDAGPIKNTVVHIQCSHLINSEVDWLLVYSRLQVHP